MLLQYLIPILYLLLLLTMMGATVWELVRPRKIKDQP